MCTDPHLPHVFTVKFKTKCSQYIEHLEHRSKNRPVRYVPAASLGCGTSSKVIRIAEEAPQSCAIYIYDVTMHGWIVAMLCNVMHCNVVCIYVSMYACMCACIYGSVCMYVCMMDVSMHKCMDACMHVWIMNVCIVCIDGRMEEWMDACMRGMIVLTDSFPLLKDWFQDFCW